MLNIALGWSLSRGLIWVRERLGWKLFTAIILAWIALAILVKILFP